MQRPARKLILVGVACAMLAAAVGAAAAAASSSGQIRIGSAPRRPAGTKVLGLVAAPTHLSVTVTLKPRDPAALTAYATAVSTPGSPEYHHYLTVAQFAQEFGPTSAQIAAVRSSLRSQGLNPGPVSANRLSIRVDATAGTLSHAFSTPIQQVRTPSGRTAYANAQPPQLPSSVSGTVQAVIGLDNLHLPRPLGLARRRSAVRSAPQAAKPQVDTGGPQPCTTATTVAATQGPSYTADQIASAYSFSGLYGASNFGSGQTVALYELEGNFPSDITAFQDCYGTSASVSYEKVDGGPPSPDPANEDGLETELDAESVIGLAPQANVIIYQGPNNGGSGPYDTYNKIITDDSASVISTSWGLCEADLGLSAAQAENTLFEEAATQGQTVLAAAGDNGSEDCYGDGNGDTSLATHDPASQPFVTGAGGTSLTSIGPPPSETVWNDGVSSGNGAGGGGISSFWPMPSYQSHQSSSLNVINSHSSGSPCGAGSGYCREVPDVSASADPDHGYTVYYDGDGSDTDATAWGGVGGTSEAAPLWAALMALTDDESGCSGSPVGFANPKLYFVGAQEFSGDFNDITSGDNDYTGTNGGLYPAGSRYDMASGIGSPVASGLATALCSHSVAVDSPGSQASVLHAPLSLQINGYDEDGNPLTYSASGLPPGLSINSSSGVISGKPSALGSYTTTVKATDTKGRTNSSTFAWSVIPATVIVANPGDPIGQLGTPTSLQIHASDNNADPLSYSATGLPPGLSINSSTGLITGTPSRVGSYPVAVSAADPGSPTGHTAFTWTIGAKPKLSHASLTGVRRGAPRLAFTLAAGTDAPALQRIAIRLSGGLSFSRKGKNLSHDVSVRSASGRRLKFKAKVKGGVLTITLATPATKVKIVITHPEIIPSARLASRIRSGHAGRLQLVVKPTDVTALTTKLVLKLKPS